MNWLVFHIASGQAFFTGVALVIVAALASTRSHAACRRITGFCFLIGSIAIVVSATPIPFWVYGVAGLVTLVWIASAVLKKWRRGSAYAVAVVWLVAALIEAPYHVTQSLQPASSRSLSVIGDSITAGMGGDDKAETWPRILARTRGLDVQDISHAGETAASALKRARSQPVTAPVVIVEIGGNDLLGSTTAAQFAEDLEALLSHVATPSRQVVMFELPLPPFCHEYGRAQRLVAARHNVILVPKRVLLSILAGSDSTVDTIHLTQTGHQAMVDRVWSLIRSAYELDAESPSK
ncbi:MAG: hypothetical protein KJ000_05665 [Pirellulaceae bacterium]|nr:hypothetical protein [Pirellulaceae bacterium]